MRRLLHSWWTFPLVAALLALAPQVAVQAAPARLMTATAYGPSRKDNYPYGATDYFGQPLRPGDVAVDPSVIPLGTRLWVSGYRSPALPAGGFEAVADDEGDAIQGNRIDIYLAAGRRAVSKFGIQRIRVTVLGR